MYYALVNPIHVDIVHQYVIVFFYLVLLYCNIKGAYRLIVPLVDCEAPSATTVYGYFF
jgi:hypothetical protein